MRSFFTDIPIDKRCREAFDHFLGEAKKDWPQMYQSHQGMLALAFSRYGEKSVSDAILKSLKESCVSDEESGMYWKRPVDPYWEWIEPAISTQALMIEVFDEAGSDRASVDALKTWLLRNKQTMHWPTTIATVEAVYGLLLRGDDWLGHHPDVEIHIGDITIDSTHLAETVPEAGTGYLKMSWTEPDIKRNMGNINVTKKLSGPAWGGVFWNYFEDIDKIKPAGTPLMIKKTLFRIEQGPTGPRSVPIEPEGSVKVGDKLLVHLDVTSDRDMDYVHIKDMRASGFEVSEVFSGYQQQSNADYYKCIHDASVDFFFSSLRKGNYTFEYPLVVAHAGCFESGIARIECMYAPEFSGHSEGARVKVED